LITENCRKGIRDTTGIKPTDATDAKSNDALIEVTLVEESDESSSDCDSDHSDDAKPVSTLSDSVVDSVDVLAKAADEAESSEVKESREIADELTNNPEVSTASLVPVDEPVTETQAE
jgi:hypothetical protein